MENIEVLKEFIPEGAFSEIKNLLKKYPISIEIVKQRKTRHGDFRRMPNGKVKITINNSLNKYQFLLTLVHEIAHFVVFLNYKNVKPHGKEWKQTFQHLMLPFLKPEIYPDTILSPLANYLKNPKASTDSDINLSLALKNKTKNSEKNFIFELSFGSEFLYQNRNFIVENKKRKRLVCLEIQTQKRFLFNPLVEVEFIK
ncbi:SprT-like domain-containing protein [Aureivirga sp. CE67]|uniref:SprT-like domain-containing protein n=1 Tax=Aureivirga sp. CE67 TaxID=1788983 RepID=UPI0018CB2E09|nr:SprT-like domain-containing protein [Aureivirga sp. CE67]